MRPYDRLIGGALGGPKEADGLLPDHVPWHDPAG
jgi:hypothetical protein